MTDHINLPQLPTGRALFAFEQMRAALQGQPALLAQLDAARDAAQALRTLEAQHAAEAEARRSAARGEAQAIDYQLDRTLGELANLCAALSKLGEEHPQGAAAQAFSARFFPNGVTEIIRAVYEDQLLKIESLLSAIEQAPAADWVATLPIEPYVETLKTLTPKYRAELEKSAPATVTYDQLRAERRAAHQQLAYLVAGVYFTLRDSHDEALTPLTRQIERHRALRKGRRAVTVDVDPQTGDEVEVDAPTEGE